MWPKPINFLFSRAHYYAQIRCPAKCNSPIRKPIPKPKKRSWNPALWLYDHTHQTPTKIRWLENPPNQTIDPKAITLLSTN